MPLSSINRIRYEFDGTGISPNNLVSGERHTTSNQKTKVITPRYGAFYKEGLVVTEAASGTRIEDSYIELSDPSEQVALKTGKAAYHNILITKPNAPTEYIISYQTVGGIYTTEKTEEIYRRLQDLSTDKRPQDWARIANKPAAYNPAEHYHKLDNVFGFEHLVYILERFVYAMQLGDEASHDSIWDAMNRFHGELERIRRDTSSTIDGSVSPHIARQDNPHRVTAAQVGTLTSQQINTLVEAVKSTVNTHVGKRDNPHRVTAAQVGTYTTAEITQRINTAKDEVTGLLNLHKADRNNPHGVTAAQVGTLTTNEINTLVNAATKLINDHKNDRRNPHGVTAAQVGAYTKVETNQQISASEGRSTNALGTHKADYNNPHKVTAAQVGTLTTSEIRQLVEAVRTELNQFKGLRSNPHQVTATQVNAYSKQEIENKLTALEQKITAAVTRQLEQYFANGKLKVGFLPISTSRGNELRVSGDGIYYDFKSSQFVRDNGYVKPSVYQGISGATWSSQDGTREHVLFPATYA